MSEADETGAGAPVNHSRASYSFERGVWRATCRGCGWITGNASRRRAVAQFRLHSREVAGLPRAELNVVDLVTLEASNFLTLEARRGEPLGESQ